MVSFSLAGYLSFTLCCKSRIIHSVVKVESEGKRESTTSHDVYQSFRPGKVVLDDQNGLVITPTLIPKYEPLQVLFGFGAEVEVSSPPKLREQMKEMVEKRMEKYK